MFAVAKMCCWCWFLNNLLLESPAKHYHDCSNSRTHLPLPTRIDFEVETTWLSFRILQVNADVNPVQFSHSVLIESFWAPI